MMASLRHGALVLAYRQEDYIAYCLEALHAVVDCLVVVYSSVPFSKYNAKARIDFGGDDGTRAILDSALARMSNLVVVEGTWRDEEEMRNEGLGVLVESRMDVCLIVDADEFYPDDGLPRLREYVEKHNAPGTVFWARPRMCYKRFDYEVVAPSMRLPVAVHMDATTEFVDRRIPSGIKHLLPQSFYYWHMGYVLSDMRMWEKINTFGHAHEIVDGWFANKWLSWTPLTRDLDRVRPHRWQSTKAIDPSILPSVLRTHKFFPKG